MRRRHSSACHTGKRLGPLVRGLALVLALAAAAPGPRPAAAQELDGSAQLRGRQTVAVKGCGRSGAGIALAVRVETGGTWRATGDDVGFAGTHTPAGRRGRTVTLDLDEPSLARLLATVAADSATRCGMAPALGAVEVRKGLMRVNRRRTRARLTLKVRLASADAAPRGRTVYTVRAKGRWTAAGS